MKRVEILEVRFEKENASVLLEVDGAEVDLMFAHTEASRELIGVDTQTVGETGAAYMIATVILAISCSMLLGATYVLWSWIIPTLRRDIERVNNELRAERVQRTKSDEKLGNLRTAIEFATRI